jgi:hypothetical protein
MIGRPRKTLLASKVSALTKAVANVKGKCQTIWHFGKQVWYIPFLWSLAWYSYWIFRSVIVLKTPLLQINAIDYFGAVVSMAALLVAGYRAKGPIKKSVAKITQINVKRTLSHNNPMEAKQIRPLSRKTEPSLQMLTAKQPQLKILNKLSVEKRIQAPEMAPPRKPVQQVSRANEITRSRDKPVSPPKDFSTECLTCAKLVNCTYRQQRVAELNSMGSNALPCSFAASFS